MTLSLAKCISILLADSFFEVADRIDSEEQPLSQILVEYLDQVRLESPNTSDYMDHILNVTFIKKLA